MKTVITAFLALLCPLVNAQDSFAISEGSNGSSFTSTFSLSENSPRQKPKPKPIPGLRMKQAGTALTVVGSVLIIGGIILTPANNRDNNQSPSATKDSKAKLGVGFIVGGVCTLVPGTILISKGWKKYKTYMIEKQNRVSLGIGGRGLSLCYKF